MSVNPGDPRLGIRTDAQAKSPAAGDGWVGGDAARKLVRHLIKAVIPGGASWPESAGATVVVPAFYFMRVDNRSPSGVGEADVLCSLDGPVKQAGDVFAYWDRFNAGERRTRNVGMPGTDVPAKELHFLNIGTQQATLWIEVSLTPIIDISTSGTTTIKDGAGSGLSGGVATDGDGLANANGVVAGAREYVYNGATWDRVRSAGAAGTGIQAVGDISSFTVETTVLLGASATFTGAMHDGLNYNWFGAKSNVSGGQAGTLFVDESSAATGANIYQVTTQAAAAEPTTHGSPATVAATTFGARITPLKTVLRFLRCVYVNGATAQTGTFEIQSALSPLN